MNASGLQALAFDFDGVVVDSMPRQEKVWCRAVDEVLGAAAPQARAAILANLYAGKAGPSMFAGVHASEEQRLLLRERKDRHWRDLREGVSLFSGVREVLPRLARRYPIGIATTADRSYVTAVLAPSGLLAHVRRIVTDQDVDAPKPAPEMLRRLAFELQVPASALCMIGDTETDRAMCQAAGCTFLLFAGKNRTGEPPCVGSWEEIARWFGVAVAGDYLAIRQTA